MQLSRKKRKWISIGVGLVGLITIVGLSDLIFLIPQETARVPIQETLTQESQNIETISTTTPIVQPTDIPNATNTVEFNL